MKYRKEIKTMPNHRNWHVAAFILASLIIAPFQVLNKLSEHYTFLKIYTFLAGSVICVYTGLLCRNLKALRAQGVTRGADFGWAAVYRGLYRYCRKLGGALWKQLLLMLWLLIAIIPITVFAVVSFGLNSIGDLANPFNHFIETNLPGFYSCFCIPCIDDSHVY